MITVLVLVVQVAAVRPRLSRRSDRILAGQDAPRSRSHYAYVALEVAKVAALLATGCHAADGLTQRTQPRAPR